MRFFLLICAAAAGLAAQTFTLGTASDPCTGGSIDSYAGFNPLPAFTSVRYDAVGFSCVFHSIHPLRALVTLSFIEAKVNVAGARMFDLSVNGVAYLQNFDIYANGGIDPSQIVQRQFYVLLAPDQNVTIRLSTKARSAVLFKVQIDPVTQKATEYFQVSCSSNPPLLCPAGQPQNVFTLKNVPISTDCVMVFASGIKRYSFIGDFSVQLGPPATVTIPLALGQNYYVEIDYIWRMP